MTLKASNYPTVRPTLDLHFAQTKRLDPRVTFSRSSSGTYFDANGVLRSAGTNQARFDHDPTTGESLGLLVEEARTNSWTYSEYFDDAAWTKTNVVVTPNTLLAPDGNFTAELLSSQAAGTATVNRTFTRNNPAFSVFIKAGSSSTANVKIQSDVVGRNVSYNVNLSTGVLAAGTGNTGNLTGWTEYTSISSVGNGWYRIFIGFASSTQTVNSTYSISPSSNGSASAANESVYIWGAQLEAGSFPTSYIPTPAIFTTRFTTATYYNANGTIQTAGINVARDNAYFPDENGIMHPAGLLLEAAATNLLTYSEQFDNPTWTVANGATRTADQIAAPNGTLTADLVGGISIASYLQQSVTTSGLTYTMSVYAKAGTLSSLGFGGTGLGTWASFDLATQTCSSNAKLEVLPNGWFRCSATKDLTSSSVRITLGSGNLYLWGAQLEIGSFPTSYIPTTTSTVTRAADVSTSATVTRSADVAQITGANFSSWYNSQSGSLYLDATPSSPYSTAIDNGACLMITREINNANFIVIQADPRNGGGAYMTVYNGNSYVGGGGIGSNFGIKRSRIIGAYSLLESSVSANGSSASGGPMIGAALPTDLNKLVIGAYLPTNPDSFDNCTIARLAYYPVRLPDATLQALTL